MTSRRFSFPETVDDYAARTVATGVALSGVVLLITRWYWIAPVLAFGFVARVIAGPTFSPLAQFATKVAVPALGGAKRPMPGKPKRFAQAIGATFTITATIAHFAFGASAVALVLMGMLVVAASLEAGLGFCLGCWMFGRLMKLGVIPDDACVECNDLSMRVPY
ncbi:MAG: DUF4395 domain-containing protein [Microthrixaceae bacterium]